MVGCAECFEDVFRGSVEVGFVDGFSCVTIEPTGKDAYSVAGVLNSGSEVREGLVVGVVVIESVDSFAGVIRVVTEFHFGTHGVGSGLEDFRGGFSEDCFCSGDEPLGIGVEVLVVVHVSDFIMLVRVC